MTNKVRGESPFFHRNMEFDPQGEGYRKVVLEIGAANPDTTPWGQNPDYNGSLVVKLNRVAGNKSDAVFALKPSYKRKEQSQAFSHAHYDTEYLQADGRTLPLLDETMDEVYMANLFESSFSEQSGQMGDSPYFGDLKEEEQQRLISEVIRVLKPGGKLLVAEFYGPEHVCRGEFLGKYFGVERSAEIPFEDIKREVDAFKNKFISLGLEVVQEEICYKMSKRAPEYLEDPERFKADFPMLNTMVSYKVQAHIMNEPRNDYFPFFIQFIKPAK